MKAPKLRLKKVKGFFQKMPKLLGERAFLSFLILFLLSLALGGIVIYKYAILARRTEPQVTEKPTQFKKETYQRVLSTWQENEKRLKEADLKVYPNPFAP